MQFQASKDLNSGRVEKVGKHRKQRVRKKALMRARHLQDGKREEANIGIACVVV